MTKKMQGHTPYCIHIKRRNFFLGGGGGVLEGVYHGSYPPALWCIKLCKSHALHLCVYTCMSKLLLHLFSLDILQ